MKLEDLRLKYAVNVNRSDTELFKEMNNVIQNLGGGTFLPKMGEVLLQYEHDEPIRPHFPNKMQFIYMRDRQTFTFALFPELMEAAYQAGRAIGAAFDAPRREGVTLKEALESAIDVAHQFDYGEQEVVRVEENFAAYRTFECADCYGMANIGMCICVYEAGVAAGALEKVLGKPVTVREVKCCANGDPYDEFEITVGEEVL
jgi:predicted hydrocarbon binding protein